MSDQRAREINKWDTHSMNLFTTSFLFFFSSPREGRKRKEKQSESKKRRRERKKELSVRSFTFSFPALRSYGVYVFEWLKQKTLTWHACRVQTANLHANDWTFSFSFLSVNNICLTLSLFSRVECRAVKKLALQCSKFDGTLYSLPGPRFWVTTSRPACPLKRGFNFHFSLSYKC